jgi:P pilus assembly chaperone PapD
VAALALVAAAVGALVLTGSTVIPAASTSNNPAGAAAVSAVQPVTHAELLCPAGAKGLGRRVYLGSLPGPALPTTGAVVIGTPPGTPAAVNRGSLVRLSLGRSVRIDANGGLAAGLFAARVAASKHALAAVPCAQPRARWWFTGAGATLDHASTLTIANVDASPAVVDIRLLGDQGQVRTLGTRGVTVAPGATRTIPLNDIAPRQDDFSVGVLASRGRVVAAVGDRYSRSATAPEGSGWLPAQSGPSRLRLMAGIPAGKGTRTVLLANPGQRQALVSLRVSWRHGSFVPSGLEQLSVGPGSTVSVPVPKGPATGEPSAVRVQATSPVLATVRTAGRDSSYAPAVPALTGPAVAPVITNGTSSTVQVTAGRLPGRVDLVAYTATGRSVARRTLTLAPTSTRVWAPPGKAGYVVVDPRSGTAFAAMTYRTRHGGAASLPLDEPPVVLHRPVVTPALR